MSRLGYTWYPKDWSTNGKVFNMTLELRGFYREFIDFAYQNDNDFTVKHRFFCRMLNINKRKFDKLFAQLLSENLIKKNGENYYIPSVEPRIQLIRGGKRGGERSKPTPKPSNKPIPKPDSKQREKEIETKNLEVRLPPSYDEFKEYAFIKSLTLKIDLDLVLLRTKYESWKEDNWYTGGKNPRPIKNWKTTLINTLPYLKKKELIINDRL